MSYVYKSLAGLVLVYAPPLSAFLPLYYYHFLSFLKHQQYGQ